jgi:adenosylcobyric acid synthase
MIMGCTSDAGKSFLVTALCRHLATEGVRVAPFKAQNMSNNAAVTPDGFEIGRAQYVQALAARTLPQARMNPVLLKPSADTYSQVIVLGRFDPIISATPWLERKAHLWPVVASALTSLIADYDQVIIEGAGSPAEVNLRQSDIVNMSVALACQADVYLVADIDRGGAFAHLLGTWHCLESSEQRLIKGFVLNKFRGDPVLLGNAMDWLQTRTGIPTVAIVPMIRHTLPEEDTFQHRAAQIPGQINIGLLLYPYASNLDEFDPLIYAVGVNVVPIRTLCDLRGFDALILPGSKNSAESLRYLQQSGLAVALLQAAADGMVIFGVCGGLQLLGRAIFDPDHLESGDIAGLGLLDLTTTLASTKTTRQCTLVWQADTILYGYEIHHGQTQASATVEPHLADGFGWRQGNVYGVYVHGLFENAAYQQWFLALLGWQGQATDWHAVLDVELDRVEQAVLAAGWAPGVLPATR